MAGANLQTMLGAPNLAGILRQVEPGLAEDIIPPAFLKVGRRITGNVFEQTVTEGERRMARASLYGSPSQTYEAKGLGIRSFSCVHTAHNTSFEASTLMNLFKPDTTQAQDIAAAEVEREMVDFRQTFRNLRIACVTSLLTNQAIYFNSVGEVQASSTTPALTVQFNMPASNTGQLPVFGTALLTASWATAGTDIITQIKNLKVAARQLTGFPLRHAFYGANIFNYLISNTVLQAYLKHNPQFQAGFMQYEIPDDFMGLIWHPMEQAFLVNMNTNKGGAISAETVHGTFAATQVVFTPEPDRGWYELVEGSEYVPQSIDLVGEYGTALKDYRHEFGPWAYAKSADDPLRLIAYMGDNFLPTLRAPKAIFNATVAF